jgi:NitT/TauT family transport system substrate-binding protein
MTARCFLIVCIIAGLIAAAAAQERVSVATERLSANGALFLAVEQGYFKAEGLDVTMRAYPNERTVVEAVAARTTEFGLTAFTPAAFNLAGRGAIKAIAAQAREKRGYEGNEIVLSNTAYTRGLRKLEDLANTTVAIDSRGSMFHYQLGEIASRKGFDLAKVNMKSLYSLDAMARAVAANEVDAAILPVQYARELLTAN